MEEIKLPDGWLKEAMRESEETWRKVPLWLKGPLGKYAMPARLLMSDTVYVKLTDYGKAIYRAKYKGEPDVDKFGYTAIALYEFGEFSDYMVLCSSILLEPMVDTTPEMS